VWVEHHGRHDLARVTIISNDKVSRAAMRR